MNLNHLSAQRRQGKASVAMPKLGKKLCIAINVSPALKARQQVLSAFCYICPNMILITGATGFLGAEVARQLAQQGQAIRCTKRTGSRIPAILVPYSSLITWFDADMLNQPALEEAFEGVDQVYHCAAWVSLKQADKDLMITTNIAGTANVVNLCMQQGARLVHVSSVAAIGEAKAGELITENNHLDSSTENDGYAISKLESEMEVWRGIAEGLNAVIVNPTIIIGADTGTTGSGELFETVRKGLKFYTRGGIGFVDVQDVAKCMIILMNSDIKEERFIISAENRDYKSMTTEIAKCFDVPAPATFAKSWMMEIAWRAAAIWSAISGSAPVIDKVAAKSASLQRYYDNSKIIEAIGFEFKPISQSVKEICKRLKE